MAGSRLPGFVMAESKKTSAQAQYTGVCIAVGAGLGATIGVVFGGGAIAVGIALGAGLGVAVGAAIDARASHKHR